MSKIAVIKTGGKQYKVKEGQVLKIEKIEVEIGENTKFDTLLVADSQTGEAEIGAPSLGEKVSAKVLAHDKADKVRVIKYKNKTRYTKNTGHRQPYTKIEVSKID